MSHEQMNKIADWSAKIFFAIIGFMLYSSLMQLKDLSHEVNKVVTEVAVIKETVRQIEKKQDK